MFVVFNEVDFIKIATKYIYYNINDSDKLKYYLSKLKYNMDSFL